MTKNHFATLGLTSGASEDDIKKAYRNLAKKWHPDKNDESGAEEKFKEISAAYEYLKSQDRREILERDLFRPAKQTESTGSYKFKSEFKTSQNEDSDTSYWSKKFGQKSDSQYKNSTFGSFSDEGREPPSSKKKEQSKSNQKKKKPTKQHHKKFSSNGWNSMDDTGEFFDIPTSAHSEQTRPNFSFAFKSFVDDLGMSFDAFFMGPSVSEPFQFSSFFNGSDPFPEFFTRGSIFPSPNGAPPRRARKHETAPEKGAEGLSPEYMFSPPTTQRQESSFSNNEKLYADAERSGRDDSDDDDMDSRLFKCSYCERRMPFSQLSTHEPGCVLRRGGKFDNGDESEYENYPSPSPPEDQYPQKPAGDWRQTHEELLENIRRAKAKARHSAGSRMTSDSNKTTTEDHLSQTRCKWCGRFFSHPAARHHIPFCEKWTKEHGTPLNPAGNPTARDKGSKNQKAKDYAKHVPKPQRHSQERSFESTPPPQAPRAPQSPRGPQSPRSSFDDFQDFSSKRETINKPPASSGTGLNASTGYSPREKTSTRTTGSNGFTGPSYAHRARPTVGGSGGSRYTAMNGQGPSSFRSNSLDDNYGFGITGSRVTTDSSRPMGHYSSDSCPTCSKKYGSYGKLICSCGSRRKTGA